MTGRICTLAALFVAAGCGSTSSQTTAPTPVSVANITALDDLKMPLRAGVGCTDFEFSVKNNGPGCAATTDLTGTITLTKDDGTVSTADWILTLGSRQSGIFRPNEVKQATSNGGVLKDTAGHGTWTIKITKQTNVACS